DQCLDALDGGAVRVGGDGHDQRAAAGQVGELLGQGAAGRRRTRSAAGDGACGHDDQNETATRQAGPPFWSLPLLQVPWSNQADEFGALGSKLAPTATYSEQRQRSCGELPLHLGEVLARGAP